MLTKEDIQNYITKYRTNPPRRLKAKWTFESTLTKAMAESISEQIDDEILQQLQVHYHAK